MSTLLQIAHETSTMTAAMPAGDVFDTISTKAAKATTATKIVGTLVATLIVVITAWKARGGLAGLLSGILVAALLIFAVNNVGGGFFNDDIGNTLKDTGSTNNGAPAPQSPLPRVELAPGSWDPSQVS